MELHQFDKRKREKDRKKEIKVQKNDKNCNNNKKIYYMKHNFFSSHFHKSHKIRCIVFVWVLTLATAQPFLLCVSVHALLHSFSVIHLIKLSTFSYVRGEMNHPLITTTNAKSVISLCCCFCWPLRSQQIRK